MKEGYVVTRDRWSTRAVEWALYALAYVAMTVTRPLSYWWVGSIAAPVTGRLAQWIPVFRNRVEHNLQHVWPTMPEDRRRRIVRRATEQFTRLCIEYAQLDRFVRKVELDVEGLEHLIAARDAGKGAIFVTAHFGNWEAIRVAAKRAGHEIGIIYRAFNNRYLDRYTIGLIHQAGEPVLHKGKTGMRALVRHVRGGGMVMILVDQRNSGAPMIDFLGQPAETVTAAADLAASSGCALIPAVARRETRHRRFSVVFEEPVSGEDAVEMMANVNRRLGAWIERYPEQWFWFHRRWRVARQGDGQDD